ncbi:patatin-like phospholipase family protein [Saccharomonospora sp. NPDC046836]|uniref:patatin-like phospholipase family protein n=1 Tax=Saccharomonospora sp. NPDC046836 TaxID=3156921 RepID=UPI003411CA34
MRRALVLAGGGVAGIAWELGVLRGIADVAPGSASALLDADVIVGTSAGSAVAAQITSDVPLSALYAAQLQPEHHEIDIELSWDALMDRFAMVAARASSVRDLRRRIAGLERFTDVDEAARHRAILARLPVPQWPDRPIRLAAVDAGSGDLVAFDAESGVNLVDAVAASCAVPCVWPQVVIDGRAYVDGGIPSNANVHLAADCSRVVVIAPTAPDAPTPFDRWVKELDRLTPERLLRIHADPISVTSFGTNPLSPATRAPAARAGRQIGRQHAEHLAAFWR